MSPSLRWFWDTIPQLRRPQRLKGYQVEVWDVLRDREMIVLPAKEDITFSADGKFLAIQPDENTIQIWDIPPRKPLGWFLAVTAAASMIYALSIRWCARRMHPRPTGPCTVGADVAAQGNAG